MVANGETMLRIFFTAQDLAGVTVASGPDPLWEIVFSLHRLHTRRNRRVHAAWVRDAGVRLARSGRGGLVRDLLLPLLPKAAYFPDFVTPPEAEHGLTAALEAIRATPEKRVRGELDKLERVRRTARASPVIRRLAEPAGRDVLIRALKLYHDTAVAPVADAMQARIDADRAARARSVLAGGVHALLRDLPPIMRWKPPVLEADYAGDRDVHLDGRGLRLVPSYFCADLPVSLADPALPPVLVYPLNHDCPDDRPGDHDRAAGSSSRRPDTSLARLLGHSRALILRATATGTTTGELARLAGVSPATASHHVAVLRDSGLIISRRSGNMILHTLTPAGATLLRSAG